MSDSSTLAVSIHFATPNDNRHQRVLRKVPRSVALQMMKDFEARADPKTDVSAHQLYRFDSGGEERIAAIDFREVTFIEAREFGKPQEL